MNKENTEILFSEYPDFFKHRDNMNASLMCFGFEHDDGWFRLVHDLCRDINWYFIKVDERHAIPESFYVTQVKEKFGGLRFYVSCAPKPVFSLINKAEADSYDICEVCGKKGVLRDDLAWWQTLCKKHYKEKKMTLLGR